jgi:geranylgeranyl pyrophosphate synthase
VVSESSFTHYQQRLDQLLAVYLGSPPELPYLPLHAAMRYSVLGGGKRLRPLLIYAIGQTLAIPLEKLDYPACAIEFIHAYSLIHDDLPIMDNDDWRRNKPSCHKAYGSAIALLAGDALQALAFEVLIKAPVNPFQTLKMVDVLASAAGARGMVGGQAMEFSKQNPGHNESLEEIVYRLKTGSLFRAALELMGIIANFSPEVLIELARVGEILGLLFQLQDDICDKKTHFQAGQTKKIDFQKLLFDSLANLETLEPTLAEQKIAPILAYLFPETLIEKAY